MALAVGVLACPGASAAGHRSAHRSTCRGPRSLSGYFQLTGRRKVSAKRVDCGAARRVVKHFPSSCAKAYAAQGQCDVHAAGRWRCRSKIAGPLSAGAPSKERCRHRRSRIGFEVAYFPPTDTVGEPPPAGAKGPLDEGNDCVRTSPAGTVLPPPGLTAGAFEIHLLNGVPKAVGQGVQQALVAHFVSPVLHAGLGSNPLNYPKRIPIFLTSGNFDSEGNDGATARLCATPAVDGIVVRTNLPKPEISVTAEHELFHAYSGAIQRTGGEWWDEASATWSESRTGFGEDALYDIDLQYPHPLDALKPTTYQYAMSRFVQFLDDRGLIDGAGGSWPLERQVISGYANPGATRALANALAARGTSIGTELAAFWGDRIRQKPLHGPQLRPNGRNATQITVKAGTSTTSPSAVALDTHLTNFTLADNVKRVEFEFDPPANGYFWGATTPDTSQRFRSGDSVSFCVGGGDQDDLKWPGQFPVTFTNGNVSGGEIKGKITIHAQTDAEQCTNPTSNRACRLLGRARVQQIAGGGGVFGLNNEGPAQDGYFWTCAYGPKVDKPPAVRLQVTRFNLPAKKVRAIVRKQIDGGLRRIDVGDLAAVGTTQDGTAVIVAVGRELVFLSGISDLGEHSVILLAKRIAGEVD